MTTASERARVRATQDRIRAVRHTTPSGIIYYKVYSLKARTKYLVLPVADEWRCTCEAGKAHKLCKHLVRVRDREEKRTKEEALRDAE